jgi:hypothetical protein
MHLHLRRRLRHAGVLSRSRKRRRSVDYSGSGNGSRAAGMQWRKGVGVAWLERRKQITCMSWEPPVMSTSILTQHRM